MKIQKTCFPKPLFFVDQKKYKRMKIKIRNLFRDIDFLSKISAEKSIDNNPFYGTKINSKDQNTMNEYQTNRKTIIKINNLKHQGKKSNKECNTGIHNSKQENMFIKLNFDKTINNSPLTARNNYNNSFFKKEMYSTKPKLNNKLINIKLLNNSYAGFLTNRSKSLFIRNNNSKNEIRKLFLQNSKKLIEKINNLKNYLENEGKRVLFEKKNNNKEIQYFKNNSMIHNKKISNIIFYEDFEKECKRDAISYQNGIGLFFRSKKTGLYTSHFSVILRKDNFFANDIIHKMPQYYCNVK